MKKFMAGFVALMMALPLVGCGGGETAPSASPPAETPDSSDPDAEGSGSTTDPAEGEGDTPTAE